MVEPSGAATVTVTNSLQVRLTLSFIVGVLDAVAALKFGCASAFGVAVTVTVSPTTNRQLAVVLPQLVAVPAAELRSAPEASVTTTLSV